MIVLMPAIMKARFRLYRRHGGVFYVFDRQSGKRESLSTADPHVAARLLHAKNEAHEAPLINRHIARAYLAASDPEISKRTWQDAMEAHVRTKKGECRHRWETAIKDPAFDLLRKVLNFETQPDQFLRVLDKGTVATNVFLRRLRTVRPCDRATEFKQRCQGLGIRGVTLHSYRYAWAERANQCGCPEHFAQEALGHNSKAVHRAYTKRAQVVLPSIEEYQRRAQDGKILRLPVSAGLEKADSCGDVGGAVAASVPST